LDDTFVCATAPTPRRARATTTTTTTTTTVAVVDEDPEDPDVPDFAAAALVLAVGPTALLESCSVDVRASATLPS